MAYLSTYPVKAIGRETVLVSGKFRPNGASGIVTDSENGSGWSVARTSEGLYTVTFDETLPDNLAFKFGVRSASASPTIVQGGDYSKANKTLQIRVLQAGAGTNTKTIPLDITTLREIVSDDIANAAAIGGVLCSDTTPLLERVNGATDKALRVTWASSNSDEVQFPPIIMSDHDSSESIYVDLVCRMSGSTDSPTIDCQAFWGEGDTEMGAATGAAGSALDWLQGTIDAAGIGSFSAGSFLNIALVPGAHTTDALYLYGAQLRVVKDDDANLELVDMSADADAEVSFEVSIENDVI